MNMKESPDFFGPPSPEIPVDAPEGAGLRADTAHDRYPETMRLPDEDPVVPSAEDGESGSDPSLSPESAEIAHDAAARAGFGDELKQAALDAGSPEGGMAAFLERHPKFRRAVQALEVSLALFSAAPAASASAETIFGKAGDRIERQVERSVLGGVNRAARQASETAVKEATGIFDDMARNQRQRERKKRQAETGLRSAERNAENAISSFRGKIESLHDSFGRDWVEAKNKAALASDAKRGTSLRESERRRLGALCQSYLGKLSSAEASFRTRMRVIDQSLLRSLRDGSRTTKSETEAVIVRKERLQQESLARAAQLRAALERQMRSQLGVGSGNFENPLDEPDSRSRYRDESPGATVQEAAPGSEGDREVHVDDLGALLEKL